MIATILPGSADFHAVGYNEHKVFKGVATLLEMRNFGGLDASEHPTAKQLVQFLQLYSSQNSRIQKPQFHVAISCKGHEMTEQQLLDFAHQYLQEMGYAESGQPWLIYAHHDTDNTHLHIVTSRVAPDGRKIQHDHERRRSQVVIDKILGTDRTQKTEKDIEAAKQYSFSSFAQFKAVMGTMGYEVFQKDGNVFVKQGGRIQKKLPLTEIEVLYKKGYQDKARNRQLRACLKKYRDVCANKGLLAHFTQIYHLYNLLIYNILRRNLQLFITEFCIFSPCIIFISNKNSDKSIEILHISPKYITSVDNLMIHIFSSTFNFLYSFTPSDRLESKS